jgi:hypothetical protein
MSDTVLGRIMLFFHYFMKNKQILPCKNSMPIDLHEKLKNGIAKKNRVIQSIGEQIIETLMSPYAGFYPKSPNCKTARSVYAGRIG